MESGSARWIGWGLPWGAWVRWYTTDSLRNVALIRPSVRTGAPSPQGKALVTQYNFAGWYHLKKPSPGGKVAAKQTNEGCVAGSSPPCTNVRWLDTKGPPNSGEPFIFEYISQWRGSSRTGKDAEDLTPRTGGWRGSGRRCRAAGPRWSCPCSPGAWPAR